MPFLSSENREHEHESADLCLNLGRLYALAGRSEQAREAFEHGLRLEPRHRALQQALRDQASLLP